MYGERPVRTRINVSKRNEGKSWVWLQLNNIHSRCSSKMTTGDYQGDEVDYMDCTARIYKNSDEKVWEGTYNATASTHAEINALANYVSDKNDLTEIVKIEISAPPCKSCAFVLELLGVIDKVYTTKDIYKHATSAWVWHTDLKNMSIFDNARWTTIKNNFAGSGLSDEGILSEVIQIVQNRSSSAF